MLTNIRLALEAQTEARGDQTFMISEPDDLSYSFQEFNAMVNRAANLLLRLGVRKGDKVSLLLQNSAEYVISYFACFKLGAVAGPVNSHLKSEEIEYVLDNSGAVALITESSFIARLVSVMSRLPRLREIVIVNRDSAAEPATDELGKPVHLWNEALKAESAELAENEIGPDDIAFIIYTSGTTGKPKGVLLSHRNLLSNSAQITEWLNLTASDRLLCIMPLFHVNAVMVSMLTPMTVGGSIVVSPKFSASRHWAIISKYGVTSFGSVATMLALLNQTYPEGVPSGLDISSLRFALCGSAPVPVPVLKEFEEKFGVPVVEGYGLSECACRATFNPPDERRRPGSIGLPIGAELKIFDDDDNELPVGALGEIVMRGPNIMMGYHQNSEATERALRNGWLHTGDIGYRDEDGFYYVADRKTDMIIRAGENIYPREIDEVLYAAPGVKEAATIGVPDPLYGEEVCSFVVLDEGSSTTAADLIEHCRAHLADYKCPKTIRFVVEIPKGPTGKLLKRELRGMEEDNHRGAETQR